VLFGGVEGAFGEGAGRVDLGDADALRGAVTVLGVELSEGDVVGGVHDDGDDVVLANAHPCMEVIVLLGEGFGLDDLGGEMLRVGVEVFHEALEVSGGGSGGEGGTAPVVEECSGEGWCGGGELLDDEGSLAEVLRGGGEEGGGERCCWARRDSTVRV
jgi:hypothetical protein